MKKALGFGVHKVTSGPRTLRAEMYFAIPMF